VQLMTNSKKQLHW